MKISHLGLRWLALLGLLVFVTSSPSLAACEQQLQAEVAKLSDALIQADRSALRAYWPQKGKVLLNLQFLGPEEGYYSAAQADVVLSGALSSSRIVILDLSSIEADERCFAVAQGHIVVQTSDGVEHQGRLRIILQPTAERWEIREIRESRR